MAERTVFFVSDRTGVTAETLGHSLLTQFDGITFVPITVPFVDSVEKAVQVARRIDWEAERTGCRPIVFTSFVHNANRAPLLRSRGLVLDYFAEFLAPLEEELGVQSSHTLGRTHGMSDASSYNSRIDATHFAMDSDDGHGIIHYDEADLILTGVSRSGKTPTCLYLALQYGVFAANYPLTEDDMESGRLPKPLREHRGKLYGLTISVERLIQIRRERRPGGSYSSSRQVRFELRSAERMFRQHGISYIDTTHRSIEEISSTILSETGVKRRASP